MTRRTYNKGDFFKVIKGNIECLFCRETSCPLRYYPYHEKFVSGFNFIRCKKEWDNDFDKIFKK